MADIVFLRKKLENISDTYSDFVNCVVKIAERENVVDELVTYITNDPEADSSDISEYLFSIIK